MTALETLAAIRKVTAAFEEIFEIFDEMEKKLEAETSTRQAA
jgi:hypothetical protein